MRDGRKSSYSNVTFKGILVYIGIENVNDYHVDTVIPTWNEIRSLLIARNSLACSLKTYTETNISHHPILPPLLRSKECEYCFQAAECMTYHKIFENGTEVSSGMAEIFQELTSHITLHHGIYLNKWDRLVDLESMAQSNISPVHYIWSQPNSAKCVNDLDFVSLKPWMLDSTESEQESLLLSFKKEIAFDLLSDKPFSKLGFRISDRVIISAVRQWPTSSTKCSKSQKMNDIEDLARRLDTVSSNLINILPHVATGSITSIDVSENAVTIQVYSSGEFPSFLRRY